jgi:NADH:ubiquinone oxidoreductase subunit B-like Fe-S oxidoreductase
MMSCWEQFIDGCSIKSKAEHSYSALFKLSKKITEEDSIKYSKLVNYFFESTFKNE